MISVRRVLDLLVSFLIGLGLLWYAHEHIEQELARPDRSVTLLAIYGAVGLIGMLVVPTIRDRVLPAAKTGFTLASRARRAYEGKADADDVPRSSGGTP
jgi:hypothetical protein